MEGLSSSRIHTLCSEVLLLSDNFKYGVQIEEAKFVNPFVTRKVKSSEFKGCYLIVQCGVVTVF